MLYIENGWLKSDGAKEDPKVVLYPSHKNYELSVPKPLGLVSHYTAGQGDGNEDYDYDHPDHSGEDLAKRLLQPGGRSASWHVLNAKDGTLFQSVSFLAGAWHVGKPGVIAGIHFSNINRCTVGVENENAGRLKKIDGSWYCWPYYKGGHSSNGPAHNCFIDESRAGDAEGGGVFDKFTAEQESSFTALLDALVREYEWKPEDCQYQHAQFDPANREDAGPLWVKEVLPRVIASVFPA